MQNRWFSKEGIAKKVSNEWKANGRLEYATLHKDKFDAHRVQFFLNDFRNIYPQATTEEIKCRVVAFIGLYNNQVKCAPKLFNEERYDTGCKLMIGYNDMKNELGGPR